MMRRARDNAGSVQQRLLHVALVVAIAIAFVGLFIGLQEPMAPAPRPAPPPEDRSEAPRAPSYQELPTTRLDPNAEWSSRIDALASPRDDPAALGVYDQWQQERLVSQRAERRAYAGAPPVIPHAIDQRSDANCLACHGQGLRIGEHIATPISHPPYSPCTQCHVESSRRTVRLGAAADETVSTFQGLASTGPGERIRSDGPPSIPHAMFMRENCATCHGMLGGTGPATSHGMPLARHMHEPGMEDHCARCHVASTVQAQAVPDQAAVTAVCLDCHQDVAVNMASASVMHQPAKDDCTACHSVHAGSHQRLLRQPIRDNCLSCHQHVEDELRVASFSHGAMIEDKSCAACHDPHAAPMPRLLVSRTDELCLSCHATSLTSSSGTVIAGMRDVLSEPFLHGPVMAGDCAACHRSHGTENPYLLTHPYPEHFYAEFDLDEYALCFECHNPDLVLVEHTDRLTGFRDGEVNLHYLHVQRDDKGHTCRACHETHGSAHPWHMAEAVPFEGSNWPMPIRFEQHEDGGSCTPGCHEQQTYRRSVPPRSPVSSRDEHATTEH